MKLIIAGSRTLYYSPDQMDFFLNILQIHRSMITEVVSGGATGVDASGEGWLDFNKEKYSNPTHPWPTKKRFPVTKEDWETKGRAAGPIRNAQMADYADALLLIWDGESKGSASMKREMEKRGKKVYEVVVKTPAS